MPWSIFNRPSIQLGCLKAFLEREMNCQVDCFHPYLHIARAIGIDHYQKISLDCWAGEALFAPLLFAGQKSKAGELFSSGFTKKESPPNFDNLVTTIQQTCSKWLESIEYNRYNLIGFSICFSQLLSSLYMARLFKSANNSIPIVFGGSSCSGDTGKSLLHHFSEIDYVIDGEGENALLSLCKSLKDHSSKASKLGSFPKLERSTRETDEIADINQLPFPDYTPYFEEKTQIFPKEPFIPTLPLEFSRGCWWNKCSFCNLNLQWKKYRMKSANRMVEETAHLVQQYKCLNFTFTDNALPLKQADSYFRILASQPLDLNFFAEIRAICQPERLKIYSQGGLSTVQVGIESLSNSLLKKMAKGTSVIDNIATMKLCSENKIQVEGNLITEFPTTTESEIQETLKNLDFVLPYHPLIPATFFLGRGSPIEKNCTRFGIRSITQHHKTRKLFPLKYKNSLEQLVKGYRGDRMLQHKLWKPVHEKIARWQSFHTMRSDKRKEPLQYRDGGTFLIIRQEQPSNQTLQHRLTGLSRKIYLFCHIPRTTTDILTHFKGLKEETLLTFVTELCNKRLMFYGNDKILSLAIRQTPHVH